MLRAIASGALSLAVVALALAAGLILWGQHEFTRAGPLTEGICLRVERGAGVRDVAESLRDHDAIRTPSVFRLGARQTGQADRLNFGAYRVPERASMQEILDILTRGGASTCGAEVNFRIGVTDAETRVRMLDPASDTFELIANFAPQDYDTPSEYEDVAAQPETRFRVTVAEGATSWQIVDALSHAPFLTGTVEAAPEEGALAPGSYDITPQTGRAALIERMRARQTEILEAAWQARAEGLPYDTPREALIMASIIEKETGVAQERGLVASVFVNRLQRPMRLQTDPTVIYGITEGRGTLGRGLRRSELDAVTPYNTYQVDGLPPTPIANPGRASIEAALNPAESEYLYFVADGTGGHAFARTLEEHNRNVARWRAIEAERREAAEAAEAD